MHPRELESVKISVSNNKKWDKEPCVVTIFNNVCVFKKNSIWIRHKCQFTKKVDIFKIQK